MNHPCENGHHINKHILYPELANKCPFRRKYKSVVNPFDNTVKAGFETQEEAIARAKKELNKTEVNA